MTDKQKLLSLFANCDDLVTVSAGSAEVCYIKSVCDTIYIARQIVRPLSSGVINLPVAAIKELTEVQEMSDAMVRGNAIVFRGKKVFCVPAVREASRSVGAAESDITVKGPKAAFTEDVDTNLSLLRRYIRTDRLKSIAFDIGEQTRTRVLLCYVEGRVNKKVLKMLTDKLGTISPTVIIDSGSLAPLLTGKSGYPFLSLLGSSEKVDKVASKMIAGRVAIICDGSPFVLTAPYVFAETLQSAEDYLRSKWYATFIRLLRFVSLLVSFLLPACYLCFKAGGDTFVDLLTTLLIFEILREVGVRMPRTVGDAVGIVGSLIIGDAAVKAGLITDESIIVMALSAVCAFIVPAYMYSVTLLRIIFVAIAALLKTNGVILGVSLLLGLMCGTESFGCPYMSPVAPIDAKGLLDFILTVPSKVLGRREKL